MKFFVFSRAISGRLFDCLPIKKHHIKRFLFCNGLLCYDNQFTANLQIIYLCVNCEFILKLFTFIKQLKFELDSTDKFHYG